MNIEGKFIAIPNSIITSNDIYSFKPELLIMYYSLISHANRNSQSYLVMSELYSLCNIPRPKSTPGKMANWKHFIQSLDYLEENEYISFEEKRGLIRWNTKVKVNINGLFRPTKDFTLMDGHFCIDILTNKSHVHNEDVFMTFCFLSRYFGDYPHFKSSKSKPKVFYTSKENLTTKLHISREKLNDILHVLCNPINEHPPIINHYEWFSNDGNRHSFYALNKQCYHEEIQKAYEYVD